MFQRRLSCEHQASVECIAVSQCDLYAPQRYLWLGLGNGVIQVSDLATGQSIASLYHHRKRLSCLLYDGSNHIWASSQDGKLVVIHKEALEPLAVFLDHKDCITCLILGEEGKSIWSCSLNGKMFQWSTTTLEKLSSFEVTEDGKAVSLCSLILVNDKLWCGTGRSIVVVDPKSTVKLQRVSLKSSNLILLNPLPSSPSDATFSNSPLSSDNTPSPGNERPTSPRRSQLVDNRRRFATLSPPPPKQQLVPASHSLVVAYNQEVWGCSSLIGSVMLWSSTCEIIDDWMLDCNGFSCLTYANRRIWAGGNNGVLYIWDAVAHAPLFEIRAHTDSVRSIFVQPPSPTPSALDKPNIAPPRPPLPSTTPNTQSSILEGGAQNLNSSNSNNNSTNSNNNNNGVDSLDNDISGAPLNKCSVDEANPSTEHPALLATDLLDDQHLDAQDLVLSGGASRDASVAVWCADEEKVGTVPLARETFTATNTRSIVHDFYGFYIFDGDVYLTDHEQFQVIPGASQREAELCKEWDETLQLENYLSLPSTVELVRQGIPVKYRTRVWLALVDRLVLGDKQFLGDIYRQILDYKVKGGRTSKATRLIDQDVPRTFPTNIYFNRPELSGVKKMEHILKVFSWHHPRIGYCQGLNRLVAFALFFLEEEDAFWCLVAIVEKLMTKEYYTDPLIVSQADQDILKDLIEMELPNIHDVLQKHDLRTETITFRWLFTVFANIVPAALAFRIWDSFLLEGRDVLFRYSLAILKFHETQIMAVTGDSEWRQFNEDLRKIKEFDKITHIAFKEFGSELTAKIAARRAYHEGIKRAEHQKFLKEHPDYNPFRDD